MKNRIKNSNSTHHIPTTISDDKNEEARHLLAKKTESAAVKVSIISLVCNALLTLLKFLAGVLGKSYAMIADAVHSLSDFISTIIVIVGVKISAKRADRGHPYGHERVECVASILLSFLLAVAGGIIGYEALVSLISKSYAQEAVPTMIALVVAIISILEQFVMFLITIKVAKRVNSGALKADAWHHMSDSLSSIVSFVGIFGSMLGVMVLDKIAGLLICVFIIKVAVSIFVESVNKMIDKSADEETQNKIEEIVLKVSGVERIDSLRTRMFGNMIYVDIEISCLGELQLKRAHEIAQAVHDEIEEHMPLIKHCSVHVNPYDELER